MLSNAYFIAKIRFYTAENEHTKILQILQKTNANFAIVAEREAVPEGQLHEAVYLAPRRLTLVLALRVHGGKHLAFFVRCKPFDCMAKNFGTKKTFCNLTCNHLRCNQFAMLKNSLNTLRTRL